MNTKTLSAIIPLANRRIDFELFGIPNFLMPVGHNVNALQAALLECLAVGARSIWIVVGDDEVAITKRAIGDAVFAFGSNDSWFVNGAQFYDRLKRIPLVYVPLSLADQMLDKPPAWTWARGALSIQAVGKQLSTFAIPSHYYIKDPFGVYPYLPLVKGRHLMLETEKSTFLTCDDKNLVTNDLLAACLSRADLKKVIDNIPTLPKIYTISDMLSVLDEKNFKSIEQYHRIDTWEGYREYMKNGPDIKSLPVFLKGGKFNKVGGNETL